MSRWIRERIMYPVAMALLILSTLTLLARCALAGA